MGKFCPICGRSVEEDVEGLCEECYAKLHPLLKLPDRVEIVICRNCMSYRAGGRWCAPEGATPYEAVLEAASKAISKALKRARCVERCEIDLEAGERGVYLVVEAEGRAHPSMSRSYKETYKVPIRLVYGLCPSCLSLKGKAERAILQVRAENRELTPGEEREIVDLIDETLESMYERDRDAVAIELERGGYVDVRLTSHRVARRLASEIRKRFPARIKETTKAMKSSRTAGPRAKLTVRVLLPEFRVGDVVRAGSELYYVLSYERGRMRALSLSSYREVLVSAREVFSKFKLEARREDVERAMVVSISPPFVQLMDLTSYEVFEEYMERIPPWLREGESVGILKLGREVRLVPSAQSLS